MTREQKLREAERLLGLFVESPEVPGCDPCERCCEYVTRARGLLLAVLSTPADAPCATCGDGLFTGSTTLGTLRPCPDCVPADAPAPAKQVVGTSKCQTCGHPEQFHLQPGGGGCLEGVDDDGDKFCPCGKFVAAPPPHPDEDGRRREWTCVCGYMNNTMYCTWCGRAPKEGT